MATTADNYRDNRLGGNYCGHDNVCPDLRPVKPVKTGKGAIPRVLTRCLEKLDQFYTRPRQTLPSLDLANGITRQMRGERRAACIKLVSAILQHTDLASLRVGRPTDKGFIAYTIRYLARQAGIGLKRAERAIKDLKAAGLLTVSQKREQDPDGVWRSKAAIKRVSVSLFAAFGLARMLAREQKKAVKRLQKQALEWSRASRSALHQLLTGADKPFTRSTRRKPAWTQAPVATVERNRRFLELTIELKMGNPQWSGARCREEADHILNKN